MWRNKGCVRRSLDKCVRVHTLTFHYTLLGRSRLVSALGHHLLARIGYWHSPGLPDTHRQRLRVAGSKLNRCHHIHRVRFGPHIDLRPHSDQRWRRSATCSTSYRRGSAPAGLEMGTAPAPHIHLVNRHLLYSHNRGPPCCIEPSVIEGESKALRPEPHSSIVTSKAPVCLGNGPNTAL